MAIDDTAIEQLLERAGRHDGSALGRLLEFHRQRLRRMVAARLDQRLAARMDPSDVVQEVMLDAERGLPEYIRDRPVPFYVWLRDIARDRLVWFTRRHTAKKRDAFRDRRFKATPSGASAQTLVDRLVDTGTSPSGLAIREEEKARVLTLLGRLEAADRRVLELRYLAGLPIAAIASVLAISLGAAQMRHFRALERLRERLDEPGEESRSRCGRRRAGDPRGGPVSRRVGRGDGGSDRAGEAVDLDALALDYPAGVEKVRRIIPTMAILARLRIPGWGSRGKPGR